MRVSLYRGTYFFLCNLTLSTSGSGFARFFFGTPLPHGWLEFVSFHRDRATVWPPLKKNLRLFFSFSLSSAAFNFINFCLKNRRKNQFFSVCVCVFFFPFEFIKRDLHVRSWNSTPVHNCAIQFHFPMEQKKKIKRRVSFFSSSRERLVLFLYFLVWISFI